MPVLVTGVIDVDPARRDDFIALAQRCMAPTRDEPGCERYVFSADIDDPGRFHVSEQWASPEAVDEHMKSPHLAEFMGSLGGIVTGASLTRWDGASGSKLM